jgi:hypothetical protein
LGIFDLTSAGISIAVVSAFILAIIFKPRDWYQIKKVL